MARLQMRAGRLQMFRTHNGPVHTPSSLTLNVVEVRESGAPEGTTAVCWRLITTEPVETAQQVAAIVDAYRQRWQVEEFFKAIKTGCRYQRLQLQSARALLAALAIEVAVAWRLILLRWVAHQHTRLRATDVLSAGQVILLRELILTEYGERLPKNLSAAGVLFELARLGGHIRNNGPPGWLVLRRGFDKLITIQKGWELARQT